MSGKNMDVAVRVMSGDQEIERVSCPVELENGSPIVVYQQRQRSVAGGCNIDRAGYVSGETDLAWSLLVHDLLPSPLPNQLSACSDLLETCFGESLPQSVIQAAASLTSLRFDQQARRLLADVLETHRDAAQLYHRLQKQLILSGRAENATHTDSFVRSDETEKKPPLESFQEADQDWEWAASSDRSDPPDVDDSALRNAAADLQELIGTHRPEETGAKNLDFGSLADVALSHTVSEQLDVPYHNDGVLLERVATLGSTALDILRYFADNPGDKAVHAESILGYPGSEINRLLLGSLRHYLRKNGSGWECQPWLIDILSELDDTHDKA